MTHNFPKVRFDERSAYPKHGHPDGEEIFVLEGSWLDENGIHPKLRGMNAVEAYVMMCCVSFNTSADGPDVSLHSTTTRGLTC